MDYIEILKRHFDRRVDLNPRYSLRAFASYIGLAPSKLSEILSGTKGLSLQRAEVVCNKLHIEDIEREIFLLSVQAKHSRIKKHKSDANKKLKEIKSALEVEKQKTEQQNAWYFGVYQAVEKNNLNTSALEKLLNITSLQIENAERFYRRIKAFYPKRKHLNYEPVSLVKKINEDFTLKNLESIDSDFIFLTKEQASELSMLIKNKISEFEKKIKKESRQNLYMCFYGLSKQCKKEELC